MVSCLLNKDVIFCVFFKLGLVLWINFSYGNGGYDNNDYN